MFKVVDIYFLDKCAGVYPNVEYDIYFIHPTEGISVMYNLENFKENLEAIINEG